MNNIGETTLEIDLSALEHNFRFLKSRLKDTTRMMAVVKAYAYGSDALAIGKKLEELGVAYLAVAYTSEGVFLRKLGIQTPILVLHPLPIHFNELIANCLEPSMYSFNILKAFTRVVKSENQEKYPIHLKFNTGLNRLGFSDTDLQKLGKLLEKSESLSVKSIFSHLAASDDLNENDFTQNQIRQFEQIVNESRDVISDQPFYHLLNTSGILNYPEAQWDLVRSGIGLYGYSNNPETDRLLKPVATLKTIISQIHHIRPGESVGYNMGIVAEKPMKIATLPIGHADGIGRIYGKHKGIVSIGGKVAPIIGNVCMDMLMIDISNITAEEGDEVILFGPTRSAEVLATKAGTISYELLTGISQRVKRIIRY